MSTHPPKIRQGRNRAAVGGLSDLLVRFDRVPRKPSSPPDRSHPRLLRRRDSGGGGGWGGGGGAGPTVTCPPPPPPPAMRPIRRANALAGSGPRPPRDPASPPIYDKPSPLGPPESPTAAAGRRHHRRTRYPVARRPAASIRRAGGAAGGGASCRASDTTGGGRAGLGASGAGAGGGGGARFGRLSDVVVGLVERPNSIFQRRRCRGACVTRRHHRQQPATGGDDAIAGFASTHGWHADMQDRWKDHRRYVGPEGGAAMTCCVPRTDARLASLQYYTRKLLISNTIV